MFDYQKYVRMIKIQNYIHKLAYAFLSKIKTKNGESLLQRVHILGFSRTIQFWFFQRILRINSLVKWPVHPTSVISFPQKIIKKDIFFPYFASPCLYIQAFNGINVGKNLRVGPGVKLISADHSSDDYNTHIKGPPIVIGDNCWIAANAVILRGVNLGNHVIVAAGSVVNKSFNEDNIVIAGVPARIVKRDIGPYKGCSLLNRKIDS